MTTHHETPVLIVGGGPTGLIAALQLSVNGTPCMLAERNLDTTRWPKMDITNCRSMEILRRLGVAEGLKAVGVDPHWAFDVLISSGLGEGETVAKWTLPSPNEWEKRIRQQNDGSMPREPYRRCSQAIFEQWLKPRIQADPRIDSHFGLRFKGLTQHKDHVISELVDEAGATHLVKSKYVVGCDGAGSAVRRAVGIELRGGPVPMAMWLIHFKSRDVERLRTQGQFWHIFFTTGNVIIAQDEKDTWTIHIPIDVGASVDGLDPKEAIYKALGSEGAPFPITIDEILVTSVWRPTICLAEQYSKGSVFIAGDAAHQNIPTGGYGMNTAVGDSFDIGWKLSAVLKGYAGPHLLESYEQERRPVGAQNIERSGVHHSVHTTYVQWCTETPGLVLSSESAGKALRDRIRQHVQANDGENQDHGIEMGYRYNTSSVIAFMDGDRDDEPHWNEREFIPSSWPGSRAPHVFLRDGQRSIFDWFGTGAEFTLVDFTADSRYIELFRPVLLLRGVPCKFVHLPDEEHAHRVWERDALLVRPDDHIAWRAPRSDDSLTEAVVNEVVDIVTGVRPRPETTQHKDVAEGLKTPFTGTIGNVSLSDIKDRATFQT